MLTDEQVKHVRQALDEAKRPLFFFHDDPDGFASFVMCRKYAGDGQGYAVKATPCVNESHLRKVNEYQPDVIFVLDLAMVDQEFIDAVNVPVIWIDHHAPQDRKGVYYCNPRVNTGENIPTPALIYQIIERDLWLATVGCIGDWHMPAFADAFRERYPDLLPAEIVRAEDAYFDSPLTPLVKALSFNLKGRTSDVMRSLKTMLKIESPYEVLKQETSRGKLIWKRYEKINKDYEIMLQAIEDAINPDDPLIVYTYSDDKLSVTKDLANEIIHRYPDKVLILGRRHNDAVKCSLRGPNVQLPPLVAEALKVARGTGGGHEHACGANIVEEDFDAFVGKIRELL